MRWTDRRDFASQSVTILSAPAEDPLYFSRHRVPNHRCPVGAARSDPAAVGAERHTPDHVGVAPMDEGLPPGRQIPHFYQPIVAGRGEPETVRTECQALYRSL